MWSKDHRSNPTKETLCKNSEQLFMYKCLYKIATLEWTLKWTASPTLQQTIQRRKIRHISDHHCWSLNAVNVSLSNLCLLLFWIMWAVKLRTITDGWWHSKAGEVLQEEQDREYGHIDRPDSLAGPTPQQKENAKEEAIENREDIQTHNHCYHCRRKAQLKRTMSSTNALSKSP